MLRSKKAYTIKTIDGDKELHIMAELHNPIVDNINKRITFTSRYYAEYEKVVEEATPAELDELGEEITPEIIEKSENRTVELHRNTETYVEEQIEDLFAQIRPLLPQSDKYFDLINNPVFFAFTYTVRSGMFFGLENEEWEEVLND